MTTLDHSVAQRHIEDVRIGDGLAPVEFPITVYRLVMAAGANRDFNSIHHNTEYARSTGAREMYANTSFLLGMWERVVRDYIGPAGTIRGITGFRMRAFNHAGDTTTVAGEVTGVDERSGTVTLRLWSADSTGITVGPGQVVAGLPRRA